MANIHEVKARKGKVICIASEDCPIPDGSVDDLILVPEAHEIVLPILMSIPIQLLSYHVALERGCDVDKPRNLAKSVTVE
jgi:glucosamine--fructose-6-phosphate aminotransferase (isomerizing)